MTLRRLLAWAGVLSLIVFAIALLEHRQWWQYLTLLCGSYLVVVAGTLARWTLPALAMKRSKPAGFFIRGAVGMGLMLSLLHLLWLTSPSTDWRVPFKDWRLLAFSAVYGSFYTLPFGSRQHGVRHRDPDSKRG